MITLATASVRQLATIRGFIRDIDADTCTMEAIGYDASTRDLNMNLVGDYVAGVGSLVPVGGFYQHSRFFYVTT